jgi:transcriptional regulator with XRE-family HTH domain
MQMIEDTHEGIMIVTVPPEILREFRKSRRESQVQFWSRFGVTQSRGSRFELGTEIPSSIAILLKLYFDGKISDQDLSRLE